MQEFINHAKHNQDFHDHICTTYADDYFDWKITCLFYISIHLLKALAKLRKKNIGSSHIEINANIKNSSRHNPTMPISATAYHNYTTLYHYSQTARYDGFADIAFFNELKKADYNHAFKCFTDFRKYISSSGVPV